MRRGWEVEYADGTIVKESQQNWTAIPKVGIVRATLHYEGRRWDLHNKIAYMQKKRASVAPGIADSFQIESRSLGYCDVVDGKMVKIWYTVDEFTGQMTMEVEGPNG